MAEDDPVLEIKVIGDFSEFDRESQRRAASPQQATFSSEKPPSGTSSSSAPTGYPPTVSESTTPPISYLERSAANANVANRPLDYSRVQSAAEQVERALTEQAEVVRRQTRMTNQQIGLADYWFRRRGLGANATSEQRAVEVEKFITADRKLPESVEAYYRNFLPQSQPNPQPQIQTRPALASPTVGFETDKPQEAATELIAEERVASRSVRRPRTRSMASDPTAPLKAAANEDLRLPAELLADSTPGALTNDQISQRIASAQRFRSQQAAQLFQRNRQKAIDRSDSLEGLDEIADQLFTPRQIERPAVRPIPARIVEARNRILQARQQPLEPLFSPEKPQAPVLETPETLKAPQTARDEALPSRIVPPTAPFSGEKQFFETSRGSIYQFSGGSSQRIKSLHVGHDTTDVGLKERSEETYFTDPESATRLGMWQSLQAEGKRAILRNNELLLTSLNPASQNRGLDERLNLSTKPTIGSSPIELWNKSQTELGTVFRGTHPGSPIVRFLSQDEGNKYFSPEKATPAIPETISPFSGEKQVQFSAAISSQDQTIDLSRLQSAVDGMAQALESKAAEVRQFNLVSPSKTISPAEIAGVLATQAALGSGGGGRKPPPPAIGGGEEDYPEFFPMAQNVLALPTGIVRQARDRFSGEKQSQRQLEGEPDWEEAEWREGGIPRLPAPEARGYQAETADAEFEDVRGLRDRFYGSYGANTQLGAVGGGPGGGGPRYPGWGNQGGYPFDPDNQFGTYRSNKEARGENPISPYFLRFLALEGVSSVARTAQAYRQHNIDQALSLGDPTKLANADLSLWHSVASSLPFGIGQLGEFVRDPTGRQQLGVQLPLAQATQQDALTAAQQQTGVQLVNERQLESVAGTTGLTNITIQAQNDFAQRQAQNRATVNALSDQLAQRHLARQAEIDSSREAALGNNFKGISDADRKAISALSSSSVNGKLVGWSQAVTTYYDSQQSQEDSQVARDKATVSQTGTDLSNSNQQIQQRITALAQQDVGFANQANQELGREGFLVASPRDSRVRTSLFEAQQIELDKAFAQTPEQVPGILARQRGDTFKSDYELHQQDRAFDVRSLGSIESSQDITAFRPLEAQIAKAKADTAAEVVLADVQDRPGIQAQGDAYIESLKATAQRGYDLTETSARGETRALNFQLQSNPLAAQIESIKTQSQITQQNESNDTPLSTRLAQLVDSFTKVAVATRQYKIQRYEETQSLTGQEEVSGILATAYGPGADTKRRLARTRSIVNEYENQAEALTLADSGDTANADRVRQIGINTLGAQRADYIAGFTAQEGSINRTALVANSTSGDPVQVLKNIEKGIQNLTSKLGTLVAGP